MFGFIFRVLWRIVILCIGVALIWASIFKIYPYADSRLPAFIALLLVYCFFAYIAIPALIRLFRLVIKPNHIPLYVTSGDGWPADPVNIAVIARSKKQLVQAMESAGWYTADPITMRTTIREAYSILFNQPYPTAPFSNLYLFGRSFDVGFQKPANGRMSARSRHHVRFWRLEVPDPDANHATHFDFWHKRLKHLLGLQKEIWIGAAIDDTGPIGIRWRYGQITHKNDPDTDKERDLIINDLKSAGLVASIKTVESGEPFSFRGQTLGNTFLCDGTIKAVRLKTIVIPKPTSDALPLESL